MKQNNSGQTDNNRSVLIATPDTENQTAMAKALEKLGLASLFAADVDAVYRNLENAEHKIAAVFLDLHQKETDNIEVCDKIRQNSQWKNLVVLVTADSNNASLLTQLYKAGASEWVSKPVNATSLGVKILRLLDDANKNAQQAANRSHLLRTKKVAKISEWTWDIRNKTLTWSDELYKLVGFSNDIRVAHHNVILDYVHEDDKQRVSDHINNLFKKGRTESETEYRLVKTNLETVYVQERAEVLPDENTGEPAYIVGIIQDITRHRTAEEKIRYLAHHDPLTDLPNRSNFEKNLKQAIIKATRYGHKLAVMLLDLDDFQHINDSLGSEVGDALLRTVSNRLHQCVRDSDIISRNTFEDLKSINDSIARLGGDEFIILLENNIDPSVIPRLCHRIISSINKPINLDSHTLEVGISIGIALYPLDALDPVGLIKYADVALYTAKSTGKNKFQFYDSEVNRKAYRRFKIESELAQQKFAEKAYLVYQPKINIQTGKAVCFEALVRWQHSELGLLMPDEFIPIAENSGIIFSLGKWIIENALKQTKLWHEQGHTIDVSINLSARQFAAKDIIDTIKTSLDKFDLNANHLIVEITESMLLKNFDHAADIICGLKDIGVRVYIDDFGTSYSSLKHLSIFPIDGLQIDTSFIKNLPENTNDATIATTIIALAKNLHAKVVAEGVENEQHLSFLKAHDCDQAQGFYFAQPMQAERAGRFLENPQNTENQQ